jgi:hypothetical protein
MSLMLQGCLVVLLAACSPGRLRWVRCSLLSLVLVMLYGMLPVV